MITESQIRERLFDYLTRKTTLNEFEDWLVLQSWNMHQDSDPAAQRLAGAIELRLAEYSDDHLSDDALDRELKGLLVPSAIVSIENAKPTQPVWSGISTNESSWVVLPVSQAV
jgi:hypothetical protein